MSLMAPFGAVVSFLTRWCTACVADSGKFMLPQPRMIPKEMLGQS